MHQNARSDKAYYLMPLFMNIVSPIVPREFLSTYPKKTDFDKLLICRDQPNLAHELPGHELSRVNRIC